MRPRRRKARGRRGGSGGVPSEAAVLHERVAGCEPLRAAPASIIPAVDTFLQQIVNGLTLGCVYAVVALGYTMVYGIIQLINFAHGEVVMIGCMVAFTIINLLVPTGLPPLAIVLIGTGCAVPVCMLVGYSVERLAYRPLRHAPRLAPLITAIGVSIILQHLALMVWSRNVLAFPQIIQLKLFHLGSSEHAAAISNIQVAIIVTSVAMMAGLKIGRASCR